MRDFRKEHDDVRLSPHINSKGKLNQSVTGNPLNGYGKPTPVEPAINDLMTHQFGKEYLYKHHLMLQIDE